MHKIVLDVLVTKGPFVIHLTILRNVPRTTLLLYNIVQIGR